MSLLLGRCLRLFVVALAFGISACATTELADPSDPFESVNRKIYAFNKAIDEAVLAPTAESYRDYVNPVFRYSIRSFLGNFRDLWTGVNNVLQGKPVAALTDFTRVTLNTTIGFFGLADPASEMGFPKQREDFGQTLGVWGVPNGPYIVLPFFGPSNGRDAVGFGVDLVADPSDQVFSVTQDQLGVTVVSIIDGREALLGASNLLPGIALDEYSFVRDAYLQRRRNVIFDGDPPFDDDEPPPDYDD